MHFHKFNVNHTTADKLKLMTQTVVAEPVQEVNSNPSPVKRKANKHEVDEEQEDYVVKRPKTADEREMETIQTKAETFVLDLPPIKILADDEHIEGVNDLLIQQVKQYIDWITIEPQLKNYHEHFRELLHNPRIRNADDYAKLLKKLQKLFPLMVKHVEQKSIPSFNEQQLGPDVCGIGVFDRLDYIANLFGAGHPFEHIMYNLIQTTFSDYNSLYAVPVPIAVHVPKEWLLARLGWASYEAKEDKHLIRFTPLEIAQIAVNCSEGVINAETLLGQQMINNLLEEFDRVFYRMGEKNKIPITQINIEDIDDLHPLTICQKIFSNSELFINIPMKTMDDFFKFTLGWSEKEIGDATDEGVFKFDNINIDEARKSIETKLQKSFAEWLDKPEQAFIPRKTTVDYYSNLLWEFLTEEIIDLSERRDLNELLTKITTATDGPALIKYCLESNKDKVSLIRMNRLFEALPNDPPNKPDIHNNLIAILLANPFYAQWLLGVKINIANRLSFQDPIQITFSSVEEENFSPIINNLFSDDKLTADLDEEIDHLLTKSGTLFLVLTYFHKYSIYHEILQVVVDFLRVSCSYLFEYDSFLPLLYDIQQSSYVSDENKEVVVKFLNDLMEQQIKSEDIDYWQTAPYLYATSQDMKCRTEVDLDFAELNQKNHPEAVSYLLNISQNPLPAVSSPTRSDTSFFRSDKKTRASTPDISEEDIEDIENIDDRTSDDEEENPSNQKNT
jgi:hypothetical protein